MNNTNIRTLEFSFSDADLELLSNDQKQHLENIKQFYKKLLFRCLPEILIPMEATHKEWITARVNLHITTSLMRLLYLVEGFRDTTEKFNVVGSAVFIKGMVEAPLHLGYLVWILEKHNNFESIKTELSKLAFGNRDVTTGLTSGHKISQKDLYKRSDEMMSILFKDNPSEIKIFEVLYKESNAIGHPNFEGRNLLCGVQNDDIWRAKDRKEWFVFISSNIFQLFMYCDAVLGMSDILLKAADYYLDKMPKNFSKK